jgi:hypothetical protein
MYTYRIARRSNATPSVISSSPKSVITTTITVLGAYHHSMLLQSQNRTMTIKSVPSTSVPTMVRPTTKSFKDKPSAPWVVSFFQQTSDTKEPSIDLLSMALSQLPTIIDRLDSVTIVKIFHALVSIHLRSADTIPLAISHHQQLTSKQISMNNIITSIMNRLVTVMNNPSLDIHSRVNTETQ